MRAAIVVLLLTPAILHAGDTPPGSDPMHFDDTVERDRIVRMCIERHSDGDKTTWSLVEYCINSEMDAYAKVKKRIEQAPSR